jgi:hypothetical protein
MSSRTLFRLVLALILLVATQAATPLSAQSPDDHSDHPNLSVQAPVLKWQRGGCYASWCETGWYSSPAVADLDGDGAAEVVGAAYTLFALNGADGSEQWHVPPPVANARAWPGVVVADIDADTDLEVISAHG